MARKRRRSDMRICLADECPAIGCGERGIQVISIGPKWARFRETATQTNGKVRRAVWDQLERRARWRRP